MQANTTLSTEKQQADKLNCSTRHLVNLRNRGLIPYIKLGKLIRYDSTAVDRAIQKMTVREI